MKKTLLILAALLGIAMSVQAQTYPVDTTPRYNDSEKTSIDKILATLNNAAHGWYTLTVSSGAPSATATKTLVSATTSGTIPAGTVDVQLFINTGANITIDGMALAAGTSIFYPPSSKLHPAITYTITSGTLTGYYEQ